LKIDERIFEQETEETEFFFFRPLCSPRAPVQVPGSGFRLDRQSSHGSKLEQQVDAPIGGWSLAPPILRAATADQETSGEFAGLFGKNGGKTGGVGGH
jgi:hypothetical protein